MPDEVITGNPETPPEIPPEVPPEIPPEIPLEPVITPEQRYQIKCEADGIIKELAPLIREKDIVIVREKAESCDLKDVIKYLRDEIPEVKEYLKGLPDDATDEDKIVAIKRGLRARAEALVPSYVMETPFLGNDVEEARERGESNMTRYKAQYGQVPMVSPVYRGRSAVHNPYYENPNKALKNRVFKRGIRGNPKPRILL